MSRKNKTLRAFLHQTQNPTVEQAWEAAWKHAQKTFHARSMQDMGEKLAAAQAECKRLRKVADRYWRLIELGEDFQWENIIRVEISDFPSRAAAIDAAMQGGRVGATNKPAMPEHLQTLLQQIPQQPQRQDSAHAQLTDLYAFATRLGLYDAADVIRIMQEDKL